MSEDARPATLSAELSEIVSSVRPTTALTLVDDDIQLPELGERWHYSPEDAAAVLSAPLSGLVDLAIVDSNAELEDKDVHVVLSRLRDLLARRVLIIIRADASPAWARHNLIGCGYTHLADCRHDDTQCVLFHFDIATYKHTPDWLGPSNWANPEMWDKYRW
jgi:hypothetical protein